MIIHVDIFEMIQYFHISAVDLTFSQHRKTYTDRQYLQYITVEMKIHDLGVHRQTDQLRLTDRLNDIFSKFLHNVEIEKDAPKLRFFQYVKRKMMLWKND